MTFQTSIGCVVFAMAAFVSHPLRSVDDANRPNGTLAVQVALDRSGFSPGEIDGRMGRNTQLAIAAFREARGLAPSEAVDDELRAALGEHVSAPLVEYTVTEADVAGPFVASIPSDMMEQATLESLSYTSAWEMLAERFHASPALLRASNAALEAGAMLRVPNVEAMVVPERTGVRAPSSSRTAARVVVAARRGTLRAVDEAGRVLLHAPVTVGGAQDPLPTGQWKVTEVLERPVFNYNPTLFWDADPAHAKAKLAPGPNSPVGLVWIDLDLENYGIHGTPEPSRIGRSQSHGCVRMTNWDVVRLAEIVGRQTPVIFE
jgi:lipoprotein-anchoring transpeptidase ErfK/SrfK